MKTIAILCGRYLPGFKDGGPLRTVVNICECLGQEYRFKIITNDRDHGDTEGYPNIVYDAPNRVGNAEVWYLPPKGFTFSTIQKLTAEADLIYCCGPYDDYAYKSMLLKRFGKIKQPLVIASMGTFSAGAIQLKGGKKKLFFTACKLLGLFKKVQWSVTSELEAQDLQRHIGKNAVCYIAEDLPRKPLERILKQGETAFQGVFLSRICEMKNLSYALEVLQQVKCRVVFDIYGVIEDVAYWEKCKKQMQTLPANVTASYKGVAEPDKVMEIFSGYDFFLFPTLGENYGHVIFESLVGGCLPIISDQTPWLELTKKGVGFVLPLKDKQLFADAIERLSEMPTEQMRAMQISANRYAAEKYTQSVQNTGYRKVFEM